MIDPYKMAKHRQDLAGTLKLQDMPRARKLLASDHGELSYAMHFGVDADGCCLVVGDFNTKVALRCQRCMQNFWQEFACSFKVSPVLNDAEAKKLATEYEPVIVVEGKLNVELLLEDELILALPLVAMHEIDQCQQPITVVEEVGQDLTKPFQVLQKLKVKKAQQAEDKNGGTTKS